MGNRLSGTLAILCMDRFERLYIYQELQPKPIIFVRYVDDTGTVVSSNTQAHEMLAYLNSKHQTIQFEMELPDNEGFLPILDIKIRINENGEIERKLFAKAANKGITLHFNSHHPRATKRTIISNEFQRAIRASTGQHRIAAIENTRMKLYNNGYPDSWLHPHNKRRQRQKTKPTTQFILRMPFISDEFNRNVRRILNRHNIAARLINPRGSTILDLTKPKPTNPAKCRSKACPAPDICYKAAVVYLATCQLCNDSYVGMTTRQLHERAREHMTSARSHTAHSAFGDHYRHQHQNAHPSITFRIIKHERDLLRLHIEEAMAIQELRPTLNRRNEELGTGFLT